MTSGGQPNLTFQKRPWEVYSGRPEDLIKTPPRGTSKHVLEMRWGHQLDVPKSLFTFLSEIIQLTKSISKQFNTQGVLRTQPNFIFCKKS